MNERQYPLSGILDRHGPKACAGAFVSEQPDEGQCRLCWRYLNSDAHAGSLAQAKPGEALPAPTVLQKAINFGSAVADHVAHGCATVSPEQQFPDGLSPRGFWGSERSEEGFARTMGLVRLALS